MSSESKSEAQICLSKDIWRQANYLISGSSLRKHPLGRQQGLSKVKYFPGRHSTLPLNPQINLLPSSFSSPIPPRIHFPFEVTALSPRKFRIPVPQWMCMIYFYLPCHCCLDIALSSLYSLSSLFPITPHPDPHHFFPPTALIPWPSLDRKSVV